MLYNNALQPTLANPSEPNYVRTERVGKYG